MLLGSKPENSFYNIALFFFSLAFLLVISLASPPGTLMLELLNQMLTPLDDFLNFLHGIHARLPL